jgi:hypothetical protein
VKNAFRLLIIAEAVTAISVFILDTVYEKKLPIKLQEYLSSYYNQPSSPLDFFGGYFGLLLLILFVISWIGLFYFWNPARLIYVFGWAASIAILPFGGPYVGHQIPSIFDTIHTLIGGIIIGVIFFSPIRDMFQKALGLTSQST